MDSNESGKGNKSSAVHKKERLLDLVDEKEEGRDLLSAGKHLYTYCRQQCCSTYERPDCEESHSQRRFQHVAVLWSRWEHGPGMKHRTEWLRPVKEPLAVEGHARACHFYDNSGRMVRHGSREVLGPWNPSLTSSWSTRLLGGGRSGETYF